MRFRRRTNAIPDPGQQVRLLERRGRLRGRYRTISGPLTDLKDGVVIWVAEEHEYQEALLEGRHAIGMTWPAHQMVSVSPSEGVEPRPGTAGPQTGAGEPEMVRRPWWLRVFGG